MGDLYFLVPRVSSCAQRHNYLYRTIWHFNLRAIVYLYCNSIPFLMQRVCSCVSSTEHLGTFILQLLYTWTWILIQSLVLYAIGVLCACRTEHFGTFVFQLFR